MPIADNYYFTREYIESRSFAPSKQLAEQALYCLELVAELAQTGFPFQFKGGNSLLVILDTPRRFSIDIDIATDESPRSIESCLDSLVDDFGLFSCWTKRKHKTKPWIPLSSYFLHFDAHFTSPDESYVMLDVQLQRSPYPTRPSRVQCRDFFDSLVFVDIPSPAGLIGDKLLTLGPATLGIPPGKGKQAQRLKHVFDIAVLLSTRPVLDEIRESFAACLHQENSLQGTSLNAEEVMQDTVRYCRSGFDDADTNSVLEEENRTGFPLFVDHIFDHSYSWQNLQRDLALSALCITALCRGNVDATMFFDALTSAENYSEEDVLVHLWSRVDEWYGV